MELVERSLFFFDRFEPMCRDTAVSADKGSGSVEPQALH